MNLLRHRRLMIGAGVCGLLLLIEAVLLVLSGLRLVPVKKELARDRGRLRELQEHRPFPSESNVKAVRKELDRMEYAVSELSAVMLSDPFPPQAVDAADFSARAQEAIERFRRRAEAGGVSLPATLEAGFARYVSGGAVPDPRQVPRLSRQLYSVERVADVLVRAGVQSISSLTREMFETVAEPAAELPRRRRRVAAPDPAEQTRPESAAEVPVKGLYYVERIGVEFVASEEGVWRVLDLFATAPHFMVVREFSHRTQTKITAYDPEAVQRGAGLDDATLHYLAEGILTGKEALSRSERLIAGRDPVQVKLVVEVYNFEPAEASP